MTSKSITVLLVLLMAPGMRIAGSLTGNYMEARSSYVYTCGCLYSGEEVTGGREAILTWQIREGSWNGTALNNLSMVAVLKAEENLGSPKGVPRISTLYLDENATEEQRVALLALLSEQFSPLLGDIASVQSAPIIWQVDDESSWVTVPGKLEVDARKAQPEDAHPGSRLWYEPFVSLTESTMATTTTYSYQDAELDIRWIDFEPRIAGYFGTFVLD